MNQITAAEFELKQQQLAQERLKNELEAKKKHSEAILKVASIVMFVWALLSALMVLATPTDISVGYEGAGYHLGGRNFSPALMAAVSLCVVSTIKEDAAAGKVIYLSIAALIYFCLASFHSLAICYSKSAWAHFTCSLFGFILGGIFAIVAFLQSMFLNAPGDQMNRAQFNEDMDMKNRKNFIIQKINGPMQNGQNNMNGFQNQNFGQNQQNFNQNQQNFNQNQQNFNQNQQNFNQNQQNFNPNQQNFNQNNQNFGQNQNFH